MNTKQLISLFIILQLIGLFCGAYITPDLLDPDFRENYGRAKKDGNGEWMEIYATRHIASGLFGYFPFALVSVALILPVLIRHYPTHLPSIHTKVLASIIVVFTAFMFSGGIGYLLAFGGLRLSQAEATAFTSTPIALSLMIVGAFGFLVLATLPEKLNPKTVWLKLFVAIALIVLAWLCLESLLVTMYGKRR